MRATDDGSMSARCDVVTGHIAVSVDPLVDVKCGITVELLNLVCLANRRIFLVKNRDSKL